MADKISLDLVGELRKNFELQEKLCDGLIHELRKNYMQYNNRDIKNCKAFLDEISNDGFTERYRKLVRGLDADSTECVCLILNRIEWLVKHNKNPDKHTRGLADIFTPKEIAELEKMRREFHGEIVELDGGCFAYRQYIFPTREFPASSVYYRHHLCTLRHPERIKGKDIIDAGAYIGDSVLVFSELTDGNIYAFEPVDKNYELLLKTIELNGTPNVTPVKVALGSKDEELPMKLQGGASTFTTKTTFYVEGAATENIKVTTLDGYLRDRNPDIGLIKVDVEGFEQEFLKGAAETIKKHRPTLLISIYHNGPDFFDIKPMIEEWDLGYTFRIVHPVDGGIYNETMLFCEQP